MQSFSEFGLLLRFTLQMWGVRGGGVHPIKRTFSILCSLHYNTAHFKRFILTDKNQVFVVTTNTVQTNHILMLFSRVRAKKLLFMSCHPEEGKKHKIIDIFHCRQLSFCLVEGRPEEHN